MNILKINEKLLNICLKKLRIMEEDLEGFKALGVDRLVVQLGSQKPERVSQRMDELASMVAAAA